MDFFFLIEDHGYNLLPENDAMLIFIIYGGVKIINFQLESKTI